MRLTSWRFVLVEWWVPLGSRSTRLVFPRERRFPTGEKLAATGKLRLEEIPRRLETGGPGSAYPFLRARSSMRNARGVILNCVRKRRWNVDTSPKPLLSAMVAIGKSLCLSNAAARSRRC